MSWQWLADLFRCSECSVPRYISLLADWTPDGLIRHHVASYEPPPSIIIEAEEYRNVFESLQEAMGFNIDRIMTEAWRKSSRAWLEGLREICPRIIFNNRLFKRIFCHALAFTNCVIGYSYSRVSSQSARSHILFHCRDIFYLPFTVGDGQGLFEMVYDTPSVANYTEMAKDEYLILCARADRPSGMEDRLEYIPRKVIPGTVSYERCSKCGIPLKTTYYDWDLDNGISTNKLTGQREIVAPSSATETVFRELREELGEWVPGVIMDAERKFTVERVREFGLRLSLSVHSHLKESTAENLEILIADFPYRGMGNPIDFSFQEGVLKLRVNNPLDKDFISGKILGYYEALEGREGRLEWEVPQGEWAVEIKISPA